MSNLTSDILIDDSKKNLENIVNEKPFEEYSFNELCEYLKEYIKNPKRESFYDYFSGEYAFDVISSYSIGKVLNHSNVNEEVLLLLASNEFKSWHYDCFLMDTSNNDSKIFINNLTAFENFSTFYNFLENIVNENNLTNIENYYLKNSNLIDLCLIKNPNTTSEMLSGILSHLNDSESYNANIIVLDVIFHDNFDGNIKNVLKNYVDDPYKALNLAAYLRENQNFGNESEKVTQILNVILDTLEQSSFVDVYDVSSLRNLDNKTLGTFLADRYILHDFNYEMNGKEISLEETFEIDDNFCK